MNERDIHLANDHLQKLYILLRRPIPWDPIPWWVRLDKSQIEKFNEVQSRLNSKIAELESEKMKELTEIAGMFKQ